jgi:hypothetical protein
MSRVLLKVLVEDSLEIPRDVVIKMGRESEGEGRTWTIPIYIFNSEVIMAGPPNEEDPLENDGDPHPFHGPVLLGEQQHVAGIVDQYMEEILQHNPFPIVAVPDQGSNMGLLISTWRSCSIILFLLWLSQIRGQTWEFCP